MGICYSFLDEAAGHLGAVMYPKHDRMPHPRHGRPGGQSKRDWAYSKKQAEVVSAFAHVILHGLGFRI